MVLRFIAVAIGLVLTGQPVLIAQSDTGLLLEAIRTVPVPEGFVVRGAVFVDDTSWAAWGPSGVLMVYENQAPHWIRYDGVDPRGLQVSAVSPLTFEIVDALHRRVLAVGIDGQIRTLDVLGGYDEIIQAVAVSDVWFIYTGAPEHGYRISRRDSDSSLSTLWNSAGSAVALGEAAPPGPAGGVVRLSEVHESVILSEITRPFRSWKLPLAGPSPLELVPGSAMILHEASARRFPSETTVSMPMLRLDQGYLQQLSDLSQDRRLLILFGEQGRIQRVSVLDVALGFMTSHPRAQLLLAFRDTGVKEIVLYRWRWKEVGISGENVDM
jgi:hypothetical protein